MRSTAPSSARRRGFAPGDHLAVRRRLGYRHHGIYVSDERVVQFGGRIADKPDATIGAVSLEQFAQGSRVSIIRHRIGTSGQRVREDVTPGQVVRKAEWLLEHHGEWLRSRRRLSRYNLLGNNCEHAATFCATSGRALSVQVVLSVAASQLLSLWLLRGEGRARQRARPVQALSWFTLAFSPIVSSLHKRYTNRFWAEVFREWSKVARTLPRRFQPGDHLVADDADGREHHGVYVSDERVIEFGIPGTRGPSAAAVPLSAFETGDETAFVMLPRRRGRRAPALTERQARLLSVHRAEWLLRHVERFAELGVAHRVETSRWCTTEDPREPPPDLVSLLKLAGLLAIPLRMRGTAREKALLSALMLLSVAATLGGPNRNAKPPWERMSAEWRAHLDATCETLGADPG